MVFYALSQQLLLLTLTKTDLSQNEADLMLKQRGLALVVLTAEQLTQRQLGLLDGDVSQQVQYTVPLSLGLQMTGSGPPFQYSSTRSLSTSNF